MHKRIAAAVMSVLSLSLVLSGCGKVEVTGSPSPAATEIAQPTPEGTPAQVGVSLTTGNETTKPYRPILASIDNVPAARPQTGTQSADIVYEVSMEGGIPRLYALFNDNAPKLVGPIRSVRVYFADIAKQYDGVILHVGGPDQRDNASNIFAKFQELGIKQRIDEHEGNKLVWRDTNKVAPHQCYTDMEADQASFTYEPQPAQAFKFADVGTQGSESGKKLVVPYIGGSYQVTYTYDESTKTYKRSSGDQPFIDAATNEQIQTKNVIVQFAKHGTIDEKHISIDLYGEGQMWYLTEGKCVKGTWKRENKDTGTVYYDENGQEIELSKGNTWIQVVKEDSKNTVE